MRLVTGPAGSGKTALVLTRVRESLERNEEGVRLLTPTATLAHHLQNRLAREGFVFRKRLIQTLSGFVQEQAEVTQVPDAVFHLLVEAAVRRATRPEFARVGHMPGFCAAAARTIAEFSSAGCDSERLRTSLPDAPLARAFLAVYEEVDRELARRGLALRARVLEHAAQRIASEGTNGIRAVLLDGFHVLPDPELRVIEALGKHADVLLTLSDTEAAEDTRPRLLAMGFREERAGRGRPLPALQLVRAPGIEREAEEIARRILEHAAARPFREIGIVVREPRTYVPILRTTLARFGIPARFYFDEDLERHPATRFLCGIVDVVVAGWDHQRALAALRLSPRFADSNVMDRFDFLVREQIPNAGLGELKSLLAGENGGERIIRKLDSLAGIEEWLRYSLAPKDWAQRMKALRGFFRPARPDGITHHETAMIWRGQSAALELFDSALEEAAAALGESRRIELPEFWRAVKAVLRLKPLRLDDGRRNVVHVLSAPEAREWVLPVLFVCGMVEKQFPQVHRQDPFFPDAARRQLNNAGIRVRTAEEFEREERALFDAAISRATVVTTLSYPEFDAKGDRNLPSLYLEDVVVREEESRRVRPRARRDTAARGTVEIRQPRLIEYLGQRTTHLSPTGIEAYLQCPFRYFGGRTLRLNPPPPRPEERLDFLTQGNVVHAVLARWYGDPSDIERIFEEVFSATLNEKRIPEGYHTERLRNAMLEDLRRFASDGRWPLTGMKSQVEVEFDFELEPGVAICGKIDRLDTDAAGRAFVTDYKYSRSVKARVDDPNLVQAPLYLLGANRQFGAEPAGMEYLGLKGGIENAGWKAPFPGGFLDGAVEKVRRAVREIRGGRIAPEPADRDRCRYCDFRDVCRVKAATASAAEGA